MYCKYSVFGIKFNFQHTVYIDVQKDRLGAVLFYFTFHYAASLIVDRHLLKLLSMRTCALMAGCKCAQTSCCIGCRAAL